MPLDKEKDFYSNIAQENTFKGSLYNSIILVTLFSVIFGFFGYLVGTNPSFQGVRNFLNSANRGKAAQTYTDAEIASKIDVDAYDFNLYYQIIANLKDNYVDPSKVKDKEIFDNSLKGVVSAIGDKNTEYMTPEDYVKYKEGFAGKFEGIGVRLEYSQNRIIVSQVFDNSPASKAGVQEGFVFVEVDGVNVEKDSLDGLTLKVRGNAGSIVKIKFYDPLKSEFVTKDITRAAITVESIRVIEKDSETAILEVARFTEPTVAEWEAKWDKAVSEIVSKGYKNIVLDLRGNLGGYLDAAVYAAGDFMEPGKIVVSEKNRNNEETVLKSDRANPRLKDKKVTILINGGTASAAEILAGALSHHKGYKMLGTKSYGKGTVQVTYELYNGGALKVTVEYWILPNGKRLDNDNPILPDIEVIQDQEKYRNGEDLQMQKALETIKN
jgi:carboxyl-terminal processing protease